MRISKNSLIILVSNNNNNNSLKFFLILHGAIKLKKYFKTNILNNVALVLIYGQIIFYKKIDIDVDLR